MSVTSWSVEQHNNLVVFVAKPQLIGLLKLWFDDEIVSCEHIK